MNWEHVSKLNQTGSFKAFGSDLAFGDFMLSNAGSMGFWSGFMAQDVGISMPGDDGHMGLWHSETGQFVTLNLGWHWGT